MFGKAHQMQSMWSILSLLIPYAILLRAWSTQVYFDLIFAWFQWFELSWLCLDISRPQINVFISFKHRLVNKLQKILETNSMISRKPQNLFWSWKQAHQTSRRGHFWFDSVKLSCEQNLILRVDSASCWYDWCFYKGFSTKEKLSKFRCIWPLTDIGSSITQQYFLLLTIQPNWNLRRNRGLIF